MTSRRLSKRKHDTVETMRIALSSVQRPRSKVHGGVIGASLLRRRKCVEDGGGYFVHDGMCLFSGQSWEGVQRAKAAVPAEPLLGRVLGELFSRERLASFCELR